MYDYFYLTAEKQPFPVARLRDLILGLDHVVVDPKDAWKLIICSCEKMREGLQQQMIAKPRRFSSESTTRNYRS